MMMMISVRMMMISVMLLSVDDLGDDVDRDEILHLC